MYEETVKRLREKAGAFDYDGRPDIACDYEQAADAIEELQRQIDAWVEPERKALIKSLPRWIPVTERLPQDEEMVLCFTPVDGFMFVGFHISYKWGSNAVSKWRIITAMRSTKDITKNVTHWMPLPEPPKEG